MPSKQQDNCYDLNARLAAAPRPIEGRTSRIADFYASRSVLITGASGFVGKVLIEKLLRTCPTIKRVFVLIRPKWNKQPAERLAELLDGPLFDAVRDQDLSAERIVVAEGDVTRPNLGLSEASLRQIINEVSVVFHSAATVKFDEPLKQAVAINIVGTRHIVELCRRLPRLAALVHVSTAYANCDRQEIDEHIYPVEMEPDQLAQMAGWLDADTLQEMKRRLLGARPNTYTYTKALGEWLVLRSARDLPVAICRPSIVIASRSEPFSGWVDNYNGPSGIIVGAGKGLIRSMYAEKGFVADLVPVDTVINLIVTLGWFAHVHKLYARRDGDLVVPFSEQQALEASSRAVCHEEGVSSTCTIRSGEDSTDEGYDSRTSPDSCKQLTRSAPLAQVGANDTQTRSDEQVLAAKVRNFRQVALAKLAKQNLSTEFADVPVFHCTSGGEKPLTWGRLEASVVAYLKRYPSETTYRYPCALFTSNKYLDRFYRQALHSLPAQLVDFSMRLARKEPFFVKIFSKFDQTADVLRTFTSRQWKFSYDNRLTLMRDFMTDEDRRLFDIDIKSIDWDIVCRDYVLGVRQFLLKEPLDNLAQARQNLRIVYYRNLSLQVLFVVVCLFALFS